MKKMKMYKVALFNKKKEKVVKTRTVYAYTEAGAVNSFKNIVILKPEQKKDFKFIAFRAD